jgi:hypothetical protein
MIDPTKIDQAQIDQFWRRLEQMVDERATAAAKAVFLSMRPGGLANYAVTIVDPVASSTVPACHLDIPYPGFVHQVTFRSTTPGSATLDLWKRRPTQTAADAASIVGAHPPTIVASTDAVVKPSSDWAGKGWIEADSTLYFYLTSCSGFSSLTIQVWIRATSE